jgi:flagellar basal body-associated protein FliL
MAESRRANSAQDKRRKRVSRIKTLIIVAAVILLLASVVLNIVLLIKVFHLQDQVDKLYSFAPVMVTENFCKI